MENTDGPHLWAIVLAGGEGKRLEPLVRALYGSTLPKQYAKLSGPRSLLQETVRRIGRTVPREHVLVVASRSHGALARTQLADSGARILEQPANRGTAPGVLLPLALVRQLDPKAVVVITPADHYFADDGPMLDATTRALTCACDHTAVLVAAAPTHAETEYGWVVPGAAVADGVRRVALFVEKPEAGLARRLLAGGALWSTFVLAARANVLWRAIARRLPGHAALVTACTSTADAAHGEPRADAYDGMAPADFNRDVLQRARHLAVVSVSDSGWSDWGTPARVFESLRDTQEGAELISRVVRGGPPVVPRRSPVPPCKATEDCTCRACMSLLELDAASAL